MGGEIQWSALPYLIEVYDVDDVERLTADLIAIREHMRRKHGNDAGR